MMFPDPSTEPQKQCASCRQRFPLESFWKCTAAKDGRQPKCKPCHTAAKAVTRAAYLEEYRARDRAAANAAYAADPEKYRAKSREFAERNPEKIRISIKNAIAAKPERYRALAKAGARRHLLKQYRLAAVEFDAMLERQSAQCAICSKPLASGSGTHIDHDHITGAVRGLLCGNCNLGLGNLRDSVDLLKRAIAYLQSYQ